MITIITVTVMIIVLYLWYRSLQSFPFHFIYCCREQKNMWPWLSDFYDTQSTTSYSAFRPFQQFFQHRRKLENANMMKENEGRTKNQRNVMLKINNEAIGLMRQIYKMIFTLTVIKWCIIQYDIYFIVWNLIPDQYIM